VLALLMVAAAVVFESREADVANANRPDQDAEYRRTLDLLGGVTGVARRDDRLPGGLDGGHA